VAPQAPSRPPDEAKAAGASFEVAGKTQPSPKRRAVIAPVPLHPVVEVLVAAGDHVKKDQVLVKLDADEPEADVRAKEASLDSAKAVAQEARRYYPHIEELHRAGSVSEAAYHQSRLALLTAEANERSAKAALESAKAELEHYTVTSPMDGVVSWLEVSVGTVSRPGTTVWGEILDLREMDARCEVSPEQADRLAAGQPVEVRRPGDNGAAYLSGKVIYVGIAADARTGQVPVVVRLDNSGAKLRSGVPVRVRFGESAPVAGK
jgi:RND family efflux transporter MFP subunit